MLSEKRICIIFACSVSPSSGKLIIGKDGDIPWRGKIPSDMNRFVLLTKGLSLIMGRKTWDSIPERFRPFDKKLTPEEARQSIVLTRDRSFEVDDDRVLVAHSIKEAVQKARERNIWVIGGAEVYALTLPFADQIHKTTVLGEFEGDTFFPEELGENWVVTKAKPYIHGCGDARKDRLSSIYMVLERKSLEI